MSNGVMSGVFFSGLMTIDPELGGVFTFLKTVVWSGTTVIGL